MSNPLSWQQLTQVVFTALLGGILYITVKVWSSRALFHKLQKQGLVSCILRRGRVYLLILDSLCRTGIQYLAT